jgi:GNAT superfamily N-acetyltransferase
VSAAPKAPRPLAVRDRALSDRDIGPLNLLFSDAFSDRYRRDGMLGVRVPPLNPAVWRYAIEDADGGATCWVDERGELLAFNIAHRSGTEGWMGPLAVRPDLQSSGLGRDIVTHGIEWLKGRGCTVIGLETMPRTMDNIGFYSKLGFVPSRLTVTYTIEARKSRCTLLSRLGTADAEAAVAGCAALVARLQPGVDFTREIVLTRELGIGDTVLVLGSTGVAGFALCHAAALIEGRPRDELRVLKLAVDESETLAPLMTAVGGYAREAGTPRAAVRVQGDYPDAYQHFARAGGRVRWTDLRMTLRGYEERVAPRGVVLSNWEI